MADRGLFITFEGTDGGGKTTQIQRLTADLREAGYDICLTREPGGTPISEQIRDMLLNPDHSEMAATTELLLYAASRAQHVSEVIKPALEAGKVVISSRFADATVVYQGYGRGLDLERIDRLNRIATDGVTPEVTFVLDLPVEIGLQRVQNSRGGLDRLEREKIEFHHRLREGYQIIARQEPQRLKIIDAQVSPDQVYAQIQAIIQSLLDK
ncbi:dTMP kinase [Candidatus Poribacteria bacterium]|nr:MAG: dTMP kinase [Candidatus Poribacteria bacterium]